MSKKTPEADSAEGALAMADSFIRCYAENQSFTTAISEAGIKPSKKAGKTYYVYALVNESTDKVVYVGKGKGARMLQHVKEVKAGKISGLKKYKGLKKLIADKQTITPFAMLSGMNEALSYQVEGNIIEALYEFGLLNDIAGLRNANERDLEWCDSMMDRLPSMRHIDAIKDPVEAATASFVRGSIVNAVEMMRCDIRIAQDTGYVHNDYWDSTRYKAYKAYIEQFPERAPPKRLELSLPS